MINKNKTKQELKQELLRDYKDVSQDVKILIESKLKGYIN